MAKPKDVKGILIVDKTNNAQRIFQESFNSKVSDKLIKFPKELGVEHPFKFEDAEKLYTREGLVYGAVNKYVNSIIGEFSIDCEDQRVQNVLNEFLEECNFEQVVKDWLVEAFVKGNGFMEIDLKENKLKVINANDMYIARDEYGTIKGYNQYWGDLNKFNQREVISFKPKQIAHLKINAIADSAYGIGILYPNERLIENIITNEQDLHKLISRKAGTPVWFKVGQPGEAVAPSAISQIQQDLQYLNNKTEWVTDGNIDIKTVDFADVGKNLTDVLNHDLLLWSYGTLIPESMMGKGNLAEGLATNNMEDWNRLIASYQEIIESLIEDMIFKPILEQNGMLKTNGLQTAIEFKWSLPSDAEIDARIQQLTTIIANQGVDENLRRMCQLEIARLLGFDDAAEFLREPEVGLDDKQEADQKKMDMMTIAKKSIGAKESLTSNVAHEPHELKEGQSDSAISDISIKEFVNMQELQNINMTDFLTAILQAINKDDFTQLRAIQESDIAKGLLSDTDIEKLRIILSTAFKENLSISKVESMIKEQLNIKDRMDESGNITLQAENRPEAIARTETVRMANEGLINMYKDNGIKTVEFLAAMSDKTCDICAGLDGQKFNINETIVGVNQPPIHPNCRCTLLSVSE